MLRELRLGRAREEALVRRNRLDTIAGHVGGISRGRSPRGEESHECEVCRRKRGVNEGAEVGG